MRKWSTEFVAGNGFIPGVTSADQLSDPTNDDGMYRVIDRRTFVISKEFPKVTFHYSISGQNIEFAPVVPRGCPSCRCAWAISMAYPGKAWRRVR
jgi:hypothetical protein